MAESKPAVEKEQPKKVEEGKDPYTVIKFPLSTEKSLRLMESDNRLIFVVNKKSTKQDIKQAVESLFKAKVTKVNTLVTQAGVKRAYVSFANETPAIDIATNMGLM